MGDPGHESSPLVRDLSLHSLYLTADIFQLEVTRVEANQG